MANIRECIVIDTWLFNRLIEELNNSDNNDLACTLQIESKDLETIVRDAYISGFNDAPASIFAGFAEEKIDDYLNDKEI